MEQDDHGFFRVFRAFHGNPKPMSSAIDDLRQTIARLRAPDGCPWDQEQTHTTLVRCLIDEVCELIDTIDRLDMPHMREELGDVLIQVLFHAQLAEEAGLFDLDDVAREVNEKLIRRHPHVFEGKGLDTSAQVLHQWDQIKIQEKQDSGRVESGIFKEQPPRLPALMFAEVVWKQIEKKQLRGVNAVNSAQITKLGETMTDETLGRALFELAAAARAQGLDPEGALRRITNEVMQDVENHPQASTNS